MNPQLDELPPEQVVALLLDAERRVVPAVRDATEQIVHAAELIANRMRDGGRLIFAGAGTSGRIALTEAAELPGTFGLPDGQVVVRVAGGPAGTDWDEDDTAQASTHLAELALVPGDVLVAVAASGSTPYTLGLAEAATTLGVDVVAVVNTGGSPLARLAKVAIEVVVGAEVLRGSTRLSAGSAQKLALNALTTTAMNLMGRVHGDVMVDVVAANTKLRGRAVGIVAEIAGCPDDAARAGLVACDWNARAAVLHLVGGLSPDSARLRASEHRTLRAALNSVR
ncbi:MAG TPA: N-acetylmuramic acid 6-phosphate etherase [Jatrophihabitantaceae bacterium]|nr:N-acetylmuramic acid 6-phosphate etherase [Jatrophihabitantaceae bacterium]